MITYLWLQGVQETFEEREPTLEELRESEQALEKVVREEIGARLKEEVEEQEEAWKSTQSELVQLVTSYTKAAKLWATYAKASQQLSFQPAASTRVSKNKITVSLLMSSAKFTTPPILSIP